jgi:nucleotide-binding universal stress UspA family protein
MYKHTLIPTDGSAQSVAAAEKGVQLAKSLGARVTAFYAAPPATPVEFKGMLPVGLIDPKAHADAIAKAAAAYLGAVERLAQAAGVQSQGISEIDDYPATAITRVAQKSGCDLIVMASHGHRGFKSSLLGSETQKVLAESPIAVLVSR